MRHIIQLLLPTIVTFNCYAQTNEIKANAVRQIIEGYNKQDYALMKQPCDSEFKAVVSEDILKEQFGETYKLYGKAHIDIIHATYSMQDRYIAKLTMEKRPSEYAYWVFNFTGNIIVGFGSEGFPNLCHKKVSNPKKIDAAIFKQRAEKLISSKYIAQGKPSFNGCIAVLDNGKVIYSKTTGYADYATKRRINDTTLFDIASCTKQFTSIAILMLEEQGRLKLTDNIEQLLPEFPYHNITVEQLMIHTSGLPEYMHMMDTAWDITKTANNEDVRNVLAKVKPTVLFSPGERIEYSNLGYALLASIVEKVSGQTFAAFLQEKIFIPLNMKYTRISNLEEMNALKLPNIANSYIYNKKQHRYILFDTVKGNERVYYLCKITGEGGLYTCLKDLCKWENELLHPKVLSASLLKKAFANHTLNDGTNADYGAGFFLIDEPQLEPMVYHTGGWAGYESVLLNFFEQKKQVIILCNNNYDGFTKMADDINEMLLE
ncbi:MAG: beta-lactamase family protein [Bacteroidetes bacterium]|nr:beta-lactamase family protein [Bacteroidota bacterium]